LGILALVQHLQRIVFTAIIFAVGLAGCTPLSPNLAQRAAQPKIPAARNFTSFSASLRCMDDLLVSAKRPRTLISSTGLPDRTRKLAVGADDMLLNAINQLNRKSKTYVFVDQSLEKDAGQIAIYTPKDTALTPKLYIRGAISQIDSSVASSSLTVDLDDEGSRSGDTSVARTGAKSIGRGMTIVTVDMHLVSFPDKTVVPGSSVANSMVVTTRGFGAGATGLINVTALDVSLKINRVESLGQAVRNLVELGTIELIGRHANVAYWECLNIPAVKQRSTNRKEIVFSSADKPFRIPEVQQMMQRLGYYSGPVNGVVDQRTRDAISHFQAGSGLIATGDLNYDTYQHLLEKTKGFAPRRRTELPKTAKAPPPAPSNRVNKAQPQSSKTTPAMRTRPRWGELFSRKSQNALAINSTEKTYRIGDIWQTYVLAPRGGFLSCFHQSDAGPITQIAPIRPNASFEIGEGQKIAVPDPNDNFDIKFEKKSAAEKIMCILEVSKEPSDNSSIRAKEPLTPVRAVSFDQIIETYRRSNPNIIWGQIQEKG
jgi:hypothetical protein